MSANELKHYGVMGMHWGVRNDIRDRFAKVHEKAATRNYTLADASRNDPNTNDRATQSYRKSAEYHKNVAKKIRNGPASKAEKLTKSAGMLEARARKMRSGNILTRVVNAGEPGRLETQALARRNKAAKIIVKSSNKTFTAKKDKEHYKTKYAAATVGGALAFGVAAFLLRDLISPTSSMAGKAIAAKVGTVIKQEVEGDIFKFAAKLGGI